MHCISARAMDVQMCTASLDPDQDVLISTVISVTSGRPDYSNCPSNSVSFMSVVFTVSLSVLFSFWRIIGSDRLLQLQGVELLSWPFSSTLYSHLKSKVDNILVKTGLCINLNIDVFPNVSHSKLPLTSLWILRYPSPFHLVTRWNSHTVCETS